MMHESDLLEIVSLIQEEYPAEEFGDRRLALWLQGLRDFPAIEVAQAVARCLVKHRFPPKVAEVAAECWSDEAKRVLFDRRTYLRRLTSWTLEEEREWNALNRRLYGVMAPPRSDGGADDRRAAIGSPALSLGDSIARRTLDQ